MEHEFVDFYEVLQISPNAESETVHRVYKLLAARLHPDNPETGDLNAFIELNEAYETLSDPAQRKAYDAHHAARQSQPRKEFDSREFAIGYTGESNRRLGILFLLYKQRRVDPEKPSMSLLDLEALMATPREHLLFTTWYLREKHFVCLDERSSLQITAEGVDYVETNLSSNKTLYKLLKGRETAAPEDEFARSATAAFSPGGLRS
jgi:curved DNA-binding protein CbpA